MQMCVRGRAKGKQNRREWEVPSDWVKEQRQVEKKACFKYLSLRRKVWIREQASSHTDFRPWCTSFLVSNSFLSLSLVSLVSLSFQLSRLKPKGMNDSLKRELFSDRSSEQRAREEDGERISVAGDDDDVPSWDKMRNQTGILSSLLSTCTIHLLALLKVHDPMTLSFVLPSSHTNQNIHTLKPRASSYLSSWVYKEEKKEVREKKERIDDEKEVREKRGSMMRWTVQTRVFLGVHLVRMTFSCRFQMFQSFHFCKQNFSNKNQWT